MGHTKLPLVTTELMSHPVSANPLKSDLVFLFEMEWGICCSDKFDCQLDVGLLNIIILVTHSLRNSSRKKMALSAIFKLGQ